MSTTASSTTQALPGARIPRPDEPGGSMTWRIGGLAGEGIDTAGDLFAKAFVREGWHVWTTRHFPSRIRGGLTTYTVRLAGEPIAAPSGACDVMVTLDDQGAHPTTERLREGALMLYDPAAAKASTIEAEQAARPDVKWVPLPCTDVANELGDKRVRNTVALGASAQLLGLYLERLDEVIVERFGGAASPGEVTDVAKVNLDALRRGAEVVRELEQPAMPVVQTTVDASAPTNGDGAARPRSGRLFLAGNEAFAFGALAAGCRFYAGYPITPATTIMEYLSAHVSRYGGVALQVEDELAAVNMAIAAGFTGARAMTATSGPGFSLMAEAIGLASSTETPVVIVDCMRPGPSTGMPTKTAQEDLTFALAGGHGEAPRIVLAAEDLAAAFRVGHQAFDLAERYQCPVIVLIDAALAMGKGDAGAFDLDGIKIDRGHRFPNERNRFRGARRDGALLADGPAGIGEAETGAGYERYRVTDDGRPLRAVPGDVGGRHYANSTEHGPAGYTTEDTEVRKAMVLRRARKLDDIASYHKGAECEGDHDADLGVVAFGANVPVVREALSRLRAEGTPGDLLILRRILPLPLDDLEAFFARHERVVVVDGNQTAQLLTWLRSQVKAAHDAESFTKFDGEPMRISEVLAALAPGAEVRT